MEIAGPPTAPPPVPAAIRSVAGADSIRAVWQNALGGLTFELAAPDASRRFAKWAPAGSGLDLAAERVRLEWAASFTAVPRVLDAGSDADGEWMLTAGLPGDSAVSEGFQGSSERRLLAVQGIARGLRMLHDALPVEACPFSWSVADRVARARASVAPSEPAGSPETAGSLEPGSLGPAGLLEPPGSLEPGGPSGPAEPPAFDALFEVAPPIDRLVVCHGDACAPNTLLAADGRVTGHVDLGSLGVADRWADIAVSAWSTEWNYGPGYEPAFLEAYGVTPDPERLSYYRALWAAT